MPPQVRAALPLAPMIRTTWSCWRPDAPHTVELELMSMPLFEKGTGTLILAIRLALETSGDTAILSEGGHLARAPRPESAAMHARVHAPVEDDEPGNLEQGSHHSLTDSTGISRPHRPYRIRAGGRSESAGSSHTIQRGEVSPVTQQSDFGTPPPTVYGFQADSWRVPGPSAPQFRADMNMALEVANRLRTHGVMPSPD